LGCGADVRREMREKERKKIDELMLMMMGEAMRE
jgi:hypothetical protein